MQDENNIEIISGISQKDIVIIQNKSYVLPGKKNGSNPFMPFGRRKNKDKK